MIRLENWAIVARYNPYDAPELGLHIVIKGEVYDHPHFDNGKEIVTGYLKNFDSVLKTAQTNSTSYILGKIEKGFENYMNENGYSLSEYDNKYK